MNESASALEIRALEIRFGRTPIVDGFDITCAAGTITVLTGPNGSGKTSILNALSGMCSWRADRFSLGERQVHSPWTPNRAFAAGIRRTFQIPRNWPSLDLIENIVMGSHRRAEFTDEQLNAWLPGVCSGQSPTTLSLGQRRILEMLRLMVAQEECKLALLDEPLSGLDATNAAKVRNAVMALRHCNAAVLVVDHEPDNWPEKDDVVRLGLPAFGTGIR